MRGDIFEQLSNWVDVAHDEFVKRFSYSDKSDRSIFEFELFRQTIETSTDPR